MSFLKIYNSASFISPRCYGNEALKYAYVPIPKNAHTWGRKFFDTQCQMRTPYNWQIDDLSDFSFIVFLRDPIERWIKGITTYLMERPDRWQRLLQDYTNGENYNFDLIFDGVTFDTHTAPQSLFIESLDTNTVTFFNTDVDNFQNSLRKFILEKNLGIPGFLPPENITKDDSDRLKLQNVIRDKLYNNKNYMENVRGRLHGDFMLCQKIKFYNTPGIVN